MSGFFTFNYFSLTVDSFIIRANNYTAMCDTWQVIRIGYVSTLLVVGRCSASDDVHSAESSLPPDAEYSE